MIGQPYRFERSCCIRCWRRVVQGDATIVAVVELVCHLWNTFVGAIAGPKVEIRSPIVGQVFFKVACSA